MVPVVNADTYERISQNYEGKKTILDLRKNRKDTHCPSEEGIGVDINRNYAAGWGYDDVGSSSNPCAEDYRGEQAFSEPESRAVRDLLSAEQPKTALSYHSWGDLYVMPFGTVTDDSPDMFNSTDDFYFYTNMSKVIPQGAVLGNAFKVVDYMANGLFIDYAYAQGVMAFAVELGPDEFHPPIQLVPEILKYSSRSRHFEPFFQMLTLTGSWLTLATNSSVQRGTMAVSMAVSNWGLTSEYNATVILSSNAGAAALILCTVTSWRSGASHPLVKELQGNGGEVSVEVAEVPPRSTVKCEFVIEQFTEEVNFQLTVRQLVQQPQSLIAEGHWQQPGKEKTMWIWLLLGSLGGGVLLVIGTALLVRRWTRPRPLLHIEMKQSDF